MTFQFHTFARSGGRLVGSSPLRRRVKLEGRSELAPFESLSVSVLLARRPSFMGAPGDVFSSP